MIKYIIRKEIYSIEDVLSNTFMDKRKSNKETLVDYDGDLMKMASERYKCFMKSGTKCVTCGIEGTHFAKERYETDKTYHFNLYALDENGDEVLMTKDHIFPKSKGGKDEVSNYQTMCAPCNEEKGDKIIS